jgi:hypothetical protein
MTTFSYEILQLVCEQKIDNQPDAVSGAHIRLTATRDNKTRSSVVFVPISVDHANINFTPFASLTDGQIRTWIQAQSALLDNYKISLEGMLDEVVDPVQINRQPPWTSTPPEPVPEPAYVALRRSEYPLIVDQLDMLWHSMDSGEITKATAFYNALKAVKDQYPKI